MLKAITTVLFAAVIVDIGVGAPRATSMVDVAGPQRSLKSDRLMPRPNEPACRLAAWPHYDSHCVRNQSQPGAQPRELRIVVIDRLPPTNPAAPSAN